jgi:small subunit ribosomal protein S5
VRAADMGLMTDKQVDDFTKQKFPQYTQEELDILRTKYSPAQIAALEAGEAAIDPRDLTVQGRLRDDPYTLPYIDDFAETQPVIDKRARNKEAPDPLARFMNMDEFTEDLVRWADKFQVGEVTGKLKTLVDFVPEEWKKKPEGNWPGEVREEAHKAFQQYLADEVSRQQSGKDADDVGSGPTDADILQYILERSAMTDNNRTTDSSLAHGLPSKVPGVSGLYKNAIDPADMGMDDTGVYQDLKRRTGMSVAEILRLQTKKLVHRYVANQTRLGKVRKSSVMFIVGNGDGWLGIGEAKSTEPMIATLKARLLAIRNMQPIRRYENRTIYGTVEAKVSGTVVRMSARPPGTPRSQQYSLPSTSRTNFDADDCHIGFGLRVSHRIFEMCRAAGITDLAASIPRSRNPMNSVKAAYKALLTQPDPEEIAMGRGKKLVDVRKVYYGGAVY